MVKLGVNVDHVATLRQARRGTEPDPVAGAIVCELAGAHGITIHLREDRRHIQDRDLEILRRVVKGKLNLEMAAVEDVVRIATRILPDQATLVPEKREEVTTEGGLDVVKNRRNLKKVIRTLKSAKIVVSLFIDAEDDQIQASKEVGADAIEIHTGSYANKKGKERDVELEKIKRGSSLALNLGLHLNAGHGLNYENVYSVASIPGVEELNIGHSIISRAVFVGLDMAVRQMLAAIKGIGIY